MSARPRAPRRPLPRPADPAILALVRALARQAAREDHAADEERDARERSA